MRFVLNPGTIAMAIKLALRSAMLKEINILQTLLIPLSDVEALRLTIYQFICND